MNRKPECIAYIIGKMWAGGVESCVFNNYRAIDKTKYQSDFYYDADSTAEPPEDVIEIGARFYKLPPYQHLTRYTRELCSTLKHNEYTVVHSHLNFLSVFPLYAAWMAGILVRIAHNHSVVLVGDGELHDHIVDTIRAYRVEDKAILIGKTNDASRYYRAIDMVVLPSRYEGLSMTTVEALACDIPCVISEAIPNEALISNNYRYVSLTESAEKWVQSVLDFEGQRGTFNESKQEYDIKNAVKVLEGSYNALIVSIVGGEERHKYVVHIYTFLLAGNYKYIPFTHTVLERTVA